MTQWYCYVICSVFYPSLSKRRTPGRQQNCSAVPRIDLTIAATTSSLFNSLRRPIYRPMYPDKCLQIDSHLSSPQGAAVTLVTRCLTAGFHQPHFCLLKKKCHLAGSPSSALLSGSGTPHMSGDIRSTGDILRLVYAEGRGNVVLDPAAVIRHARHAPNRQRAYSYRQCILM